MLKNYFKKLNPQGLAFISTAGLAAFGVYFCMYAFRKAFTAATFADIPGFGIIDFKVALVISQIIGYALSKLIGVRVIAQLRLQNRAIYLFSLIALAELALIGFGYIKTGWPALLMLFLNGLPLGMIWGIVFSYLEGRRTTEVLGSILSASFIVASGAVKSLGAWMILHWDVDPFWMPALVGAIAFPPLIACMLVLENVPPPEEADIKARTKRGPMNKVQRKNLLGQLNWGLVGIVLYYVCVTAFRDVRDNFAPEIWSALGYSDTPSVFTIAELPIAFGTLGAMAIGYYIKDNKRALSYYHLLIAFSTVVIIGSTQAFVYNYLDGGLWMVLVGLGLYLGYIPLNAIYFDRLIAAFKQVATAGFLMYIADASGYGGSILILLYKNFGAHDLDWLEFFIGLSFGCGFTGLILVLFSWAWFSKRLSKPTNIVQLPTN